MFGDVYWVAPRTDVKGKNSDSDVKWTRVILATLAIETYWQCLMCHYMSKIDTKTIEILHFETKIQLPRSRTSL